MSPRHAPTTDDAWSRLLGPAADATTEGLVVLDATTKVRAANEAALAIAGPHAPLTVAGPPAARAIASGAPIRDEQVPFRRDGGPEQWLRVSAVPLFAEGEAAPYGAVVAFSDITAFVAARAELEVRERELSLLATHAGDLIARHDSDGKIVAAAGGAEALLGFPARHLVGFWAADVCHPDDAPALRRAHADVREGKAGVVSYRITNVRDGREMWLESTVSPVLDEHGVFIEAVTTTRDITSRKANELRLQEAEEEARRQRALLEEAQTMADLGSWSTDLETGAESWLSLIHI